MISLTPQIKTLSYAATWKPRSPTQPMSWRASGTRSVEELQRLQYNVIGYSEDMHRRNRELKDFLYANLYRHHRVVRMAVKAERIITDLFNAYRAEPAMLPRHVQAW